MTADQDKTQGELNVEVLGPNDPDPTSKTDRENNLNRIKRLLLNAEPGWQVSIYREKPSWCRGHLESFEVYDSTPIDIEDLIQKWGGQSLVIKIHGQRGRWIGGTTIPCYSHQPKYYGRPINQSALMGYPEDSPKAGPPALPPYQPIQQPAAPNVPPSAGIMGALGMSLPDLLKLMKGSDAGNNALVMRLLEHQLSAQPPAQHTQPLSNPVDMLRQQMEMMTLLKDFSGMFGGDGGGGGDDNLTGLLGTLAQNMMAKPQQNPAPQRRPRRRGRVVMPPPAQSAPMTQPTQLTQDVPQPTQQPQQSVNSVNDQSIPSLRKIADSLSGLSPDDASDVVLEAFGDMPEENRAKAMTLFIEKLQSDGLDDSTTVDETYSQDDYPDDYPDDYDQTADQGDHSPDTGGTLSANEGDGTPDWDGDNQR